jgi:hypothetical protein
LKELSIITILRTNVSILSSRKDSGNLTILGNQKKSSSIQRLQFGSTFGKIQKQLVQLLIGQRLEPGRVGQGVGTDCSTLLYFLLFLLFCFCLVQLVQGFKTAPQHVLYSGPKKLLLLLDPSQFRSHGHYQLSSLLCLSL